MAGDAPSGFTTHYSIKKWNDGDTPSADGINSNWETIDVAIYSASAETDYTSTAPIRVYNKNISLRYNTDDFYVSESKLYFSGSTGVQEGSSPTFTGITLTGDSYLTGSLHVTGSIIIDNGSIKFEEMTPGSVLFISSSNVITEDNSNLFYDNTQKYLGIGTDTCTERLTVSGNLVQIGNAKLYNNFTSGIMGSGWQLDYNDTSDYLSYLEIDNLRVRNNLSTHIFKKDVVKTANGYLLISDSATIGYESPSYLYCKQGDDNATFSTSDMLWYKDIDNDDNVVSVQATVTGVSSQTIDNITYDRYTLSFNQGAYSNLKVGGTIARVSGGSILFDASSQYNPFMDIYDGVSSWSGQSAGTFSSLTNLKVRAGKLDGVTDAVIGSMSDFGLYSNRLYLSTNKQNSNAITIIADENTAKLSLISGSHTVFDFDTATKTAKIADWTIDNEKLYNGTDVVLDATNKKISVNDDAVQMYYTNGSDYGLKDSGGNFQLGSTNKIGGFTFDTSKLSINSGSDYVGLQKPTSPTTKVIFAGASDNTGTDALFSVQSDGRTVINDDSGSLMFDSDLSLLDGKNQGRVFYENYEGYTTSSATYEILTTGGLNILPNEAQVTMTFQGYIDGASTGLGYVYFTLLKKSNTTKGLYTSAGSSNTVTFGDGQTSCFDIETTDILMPDGTTKLLKDIKENDVVVSANLTDKKWTTSRVKSIIKKDTDELYRLNNKTLVTGEHPFLVYDLNMIDYEWKKVKDIKVGETVVSFPGIKTVIYKIEKIKKDVTVSTLSMYEDDNTNFVANDYLVHNKGPANAWVPYGVCKYTGALDHNSHYMYRIYMKSADGSSDAVLENIVMMSGTTIFDKTTYKASTDGGGA